MKFDWEFNKLGIYNFNRRGKLDLLFDYIESKKPKLPIFEVGVFQGRQSISMALFLKQRNIDSTVYSIDTFGGFPDVFCEYDEIGHFYELRRKNSIDDEHLEQVERNIQIIDFLNHAKSPKLISSSGCFGGVNLLESFKSKLKFLELDNVEFCVGQIDELVQQCALPSKVAGGILDVDLFSSYQVALDWLREALCEGGLVYLDEYYSLKFPGAKEAVDRFLFQNSDFRLLEYDDGTDFPRFYLEREFLC